MTHKAIKEKACRQCGGTAWVVRWQVIRDGRDVYPYVCMACGYRSAIVEKHSVVISALKKVDLAKEDIAYVSTQTIPTNSDRCGD